MIQRHMMAKLSGQSITLVNVKSRVQIRLRLLFIFTESKSFENFSLKLLSSILHVYTIYRYSDLLGIIYRYLQETV